MLDDDEIDLDDAIEAIILELDPAKLLAQGYPPEEYDPEIEDFAALLDKGKPLTAEKVHEIWEKWFGPGSEAFVDPALHPVMAERFNQLLEES